MRPLVALRLCVADAQSWMSAVTYMDSLLPVALAIKGSTIALLALVAFQFARLRDLRGLAGGLLTVSVLCHVFLQIFRGAERPWLILPLHLGGLTVSFWLYVFSRLLLSDGLPRMVWWILGFLLLTGTVLFFQTGSVRSGWEDAFVLGPRFISLALVIAAIVTIYRGAADDLVETRRAFRRRFILSVGSSTLAILTLEIYMHGQCPPLLMDLVTSAAILIVTFVISVSVLTLDPLLIHSVGPYIKGGAPRSGETNEERELEKKLREFMEENRGYAQESLTIRNLAARLGVHEYKLRRLINQKLGFRNFNEYLNRYRIEAACKSLRDPSQSGLPVLRIAMDLGYGSLAPFNRAFRSRTGTSPTQYRLESAEAGQVGPEE